MKPRHLLLLLGGFLLSVWGWWYVDRWLDYHYPVRTPPT